MTIVLFATAAQSFAQSSAVHSGSAACPAVSKQLTKGKFLIASRELLDPKFFETVILLADYGPNGASGLILNRPSPVTLAELLPSEESLRPRNDTIYMGGPVAQDRLILLIRSAQKPAAAHALFDDVYISGSAATLRVLTDEQGGASFRAYMGYAGWGPGQLESEVERGDWWILPAEAEVIFEHPAKSIWQKLIERSAGEWARADRPILGPGRRGAAEDAWRKIPNRVPLAPPRSAVQKGREERIT